MIDDEKNGVGRKTKFFLYFVPILVSFVLPLSMSEIYFRYFSDSGYLTPEIIRQKYSVQYVPSIFARHVLPKSEQSVFDWGDAEPSVIINSKGYAGKDFADTKLAGTTRIMIYGGSAVFDYNSARGQDWPHRIENLIRGMGHKNVEIINAGIPGHASFDSLGRLFAEGHFYAPDYVVLYNTWNDIKYFREDDPILRTFKPYEVESDPRLFYRNALDRWLSNLSQTYVRVRQKYYGWVVRAGAEGRARHEELSTYVSDRALRQYRLNFQLFADLARNINAIPIFMIQGRQIASDNSEDEKKKISYSYAGLTHQRLFEAFSEADMIIREVAREKDVLLIEYGERLTGKNEYFRDLIHLTEAGSAELAKGVAAELSRVLRGEIAAR